jgi:hypothetical protein
MEQGYKALEGYINRAKQSFPYFNKHIFPLSFKKKQFVKAPHTNKWAARVEKNKRTATLSARKHLKSTTIYSFIMWLIFRMKPRDRLSWLYMSYNQKMSTYHTASIKLHVQANPCFLDITDLSQGSSILDYTWGDGSRFSCIPSGILTFNRGWHGDGVICDDILADPTNELNFTIIEKINRTFMEQVMSLPKEGGEIHLVGTAQHQTDLFFQLKGNKSWNWGEYKAIINEKSKKTLWPELFSYKRLEQIRNEEIGNKAFNKEYMCSPIWTEEAYFQRDELMRAVDPNLKEEHRPAKEYKHKRMMVVAGLDIGKKTHPSHFTIFELDRGEYTQIYEKWMDGWDYSKQVEFINGMIEARLIDRINYDDTRSELESFREKKLIDTSIWKPIVFKVKTKFDMASNFSRLVNYKEKDKITPKVHLLNRQRMIDSILSVSNDLQAVESSIGHGDAFWSISLALYKDTPYKPYIAV